jgi:hypothetical protein
VACLAFNVIVGEKNGCWTVPSHSSYNSDFCAISGRAPLKHSLFAIKSLYDIITGLGRVKSILGDKSQPSFRSEEIVFSRCGLNEFVEVLVTSFDV